MMNRVELQFDKYDVILGGNPYGKKIYNEQVKDIIDLTQPTFTIVFPPQVEQLTSSFIQGFFADIKQRIGLDGIEKGLIVEDSGKNFRDDIVNNLR